METVIRLLQSRGLQWAGATLVALICLLFLFIAKPTHAESERVISIFHDGIQQTVVTDATTVDEALKRANVSLDGHDAVEPDRATKLTAPSYDINVYRAKPVMIIDGASRYEVMSPHTSARQIAADAGLKLYNEDTYQLTRIDDFIAEGGVGLKMTIRRALPINFVLYGNPTPIRTQATTVSELLKEKGVVLGAQDGTSLPGDTVIKPNMIVEIWRNGVQTVTEEQPIAFSTEFIRDADKPVTFKQIQTAGKNGKKLVTYQVELKNGKTTNRKEIQSVITEHPSKQVEVIGGQVGFTGPFQEALARLRACEAGGRYDRNSGNGFYGAYQFMPSSWRSWAPEPYKNMLPSEAPPAAQDQAVWNYYQKSGWRPWPGCTSKLGLQDVYR